jgi:hypothetical protein
MTGICGAFDSSVAPVWAGAVATLVVGIAAVFVANRQLSAFNKSLDAQNGNERTKNTLQYLQIYEGEKRSSGGVEMTPLAAVYKLDALKTNEQVRAVLEGTSASDSLYRSAIIIAMNYFSGASSLRERNLLDSDLFVDLMWSSIIIVKRFLVTLGQNEQWDSLVLDDGGFKLLCGEAEAKEKAAMLKALTCQR